MSDLRRQREEGVCIAYSKSDGSSFTLPRSEYPRLKQEWMRGAAFFETVGFYGSPSVIKLGDIVAISDCSPDSIRWRDADYKENEREDAIDA